MGNPVKITWLASYPKSGNTWIKLLLHAYKFGELNLSERRRGLTAADTERYAHQIVAPMALAHMDAVEKSYLRYAALMHLRMRFDKQCILKTHCANINVNEVKLIPETLTEASIYILRDPRDVVISFANHMGIDVDRAIELFAHEGNALQIPDNAPDFLMSWSRHVKSWLNADVIVRYEDLLDDPVRQFKRVLDVLGWEIEQGRVEKAVALCEFSRLQKQENDTGFPEASEHGKFFARGTAGHWRGVLTPEQVAQIESDHGEMMEKMGYILSNKQAA